MTSLPFLDVAIAVVFILTFLCLISTGVQELISHILDQRYQTLRSGVASLLHAGPNDKAIVDSVFRHPIVTALVKNTHPDGTARPSYLPAATFAQAVIGNLRTAAVAAGQGGFTVSALIAAAPNDKLKEMLMSLSNQGLCSVKELETELASHFDDTMERASGWYKRKAQTMLLVIGFIVAVAFNADLPSIAQTLYRDPALREQLVAAAQNQKTVPTIPEIQKQTAAISLPLGWHSLPADPSGKTPADDTDWSMWLLRALGWALTGAAISLGAPFWFDLLSRFVNLRSSKNIGTSDT